MNCSTRSRSSRTGREVTRLREWSGHRDRRPRRPGTRCPTGRGGRSRVRTRMPGRDELLLRRGPLAEQSRRKAALVDLVVTNHAMLAIDAMSPATIPARTRRGGRGRGT